MRFPLFILASICWPLQGLISTLTQGGGGGHFFLGSLVQSCCGEGGTLQTNITGVCGECSQCLGHTGFAPTHGVCAFMVYTSQALGCSARNFLRQALGCVHFPGLSRSGSGTRVVLRGADSVGPAFCALPRSEQLRWPGVWWAQSLPPDHWRLRLIASPSAAQFSGCTAAAPSQVSRVSLLGSWSLVVILPVDWPFKIPRSLG